MATDMLQIKGRLNIVLTDENGVVKDTRVVENLIVTSGRNYIASRMIGTSASVMSHMGIGLGVTAPAIGDTALGSELTNTSNRPTSTSVQGSGGNLNQITYTSTFGAGIGTGAVTEAGVFNAITSGTMLARTTFAAVNKGSSDSIQITWTVTVA
jgi:hypothetical protein